MPCVSLMIKPASSLCNLSCDYCFYRDVAKHRESPRFAAMTEETSEMLIQKALRFADGQAVSFTFQGGEPTLCGLSFFTYFAKTVKRLNRKSSPIFYSLQTNGTTLNDEWARFFSENGFLVGLSLDGDERGNRFRKTPAGESTFQTVLAAAEMLKKHKVEFNILTVLTGDCAENGERVYRFFRDHGFRYLQFIPCLRPFGSNEQSELFMTSAQYADFLVHVFRLYTEDYLRGQYVSVRQFDNWVRLFWGLPTEQCGIFGHCSSQFVAESNGNIYPCDFYCTDEFLLGNILTGDFEAMANCETARKFLKESFFVPGKCRTCKLYPMCRAGGCKRTRQSEDYCEAYQKFFTECLPLFQAFRQEKDGAPQ